MMKVLPTNCWFAVNQWNQKFAGIQDTFTSLSENYDDYCTIYEHLLPYIYEKCDFDILKLFDAVLSAIKDPEKQKILINLKIGKDHYTSVNPNIYTAVLLQLITTFIKCSKNNLFFNGIGIISVYYNKEGLK